MVPRTCPLTVRPRAPPLGQPEVGQIDVGDGAVLHGQQDVARLDVAVDQPAGVGGVQRARDLPGDRQGLLGCQRSVFGQQRGQVDAVDVAHGDPQHPVGLASVIDRQHVGVVDGRRQLRLTQEPFPERLAGRRRAQQQLEGHLPARAGLLG
jgi:hypothetical protein